MAAKTALALALVLLVGACGDDGEQCVPSPPSVQLEVTSPTLAVSRPVVLRAVARGASCSGFPLSEVAEYRWDFDDDGVYELTGSDLPEVEVTFEHPGRHWVEVVVYDTAGTRADDAVMLDLPGPAR